MSENTSPSPPEQFSEWNPSVSLDCKPWRYQSYCIVTKERLASLSKTKTTTSKASSTSSTTVSTLGPSPTAWSGMGCYTDNNNKLPVLEKRVSKEGGDTALTISKCQNACYLARLPFAGVKGGNECWCSSFVGGEVLGKKTECSMPCSGNKTITCGGEDSIDVFKTCLQQARWRC
ncbi:hypothetical protein G7046_g6168 [Stylonectria norvegica]|nr:hypothetical protein G7046_g6168 [Stylonectria norvegica]